MSFFSYSKVMKLSIYIIIFVGFIAISLAQIKMPEMDKSTKVDLSSKIKIKSYYQNNWKDEWTLALSDELDREDIDLLTDTIDDEDLRKLNCPGYNSADRESKKIFWVSFFSSLARAESGLNPKAKSPKMRGHRSYGLLQLAPMTAKKFCDLETKEDLLDGEANLLCGVKLMNWQIKGAPDKNGKLKRADLVHQLFGKRILLWGPLRAQDYRGRKTLYSWFENHLDQLPFCQMADSDEYQSQ